MPNLTVEPFRRFSRNIVPPVLLHRRLPVISPKFFDTWFFFLYFSTNWNWARNGKTVSIRDRRFRFVFTFRSFLRTNHELCFARRSFSHFLLLNPFYSCLCAKARVRRMDSNPVLLFLQGNSTRGEERLAAPSRFTRFLQIPRLNTARIAAGTDEIFVRNIRDGQRKIFHDRISHWGNEIWNQCCLGGNIM